MKQFRNPVDVHPPLAAYSHQVEISGNERLLLLSGQVGRRADGSMPEDALGQMEVACENIRRNLELAGMQMSDIVKLTLYLVDGIDAQARAGLLHSIFGEHKPCMTLLYVAGLAAPNIKVEIDAWASQSG